MKSHLTAPPDAMGALYFLPGQYLFKRNENGREITKALSSEQIARAFRDYETDTGWLTTRRILRYREEPEGNYFLSYEPAGRRTIFVQTQNHETQEITLPLPTLILFGCKSEFYLWATKSRQVTEKTRLFSAPLPNLGGSGEGKICFGSNEAPEVKAENIDRVWNLIFDTPFNRDQANNKCRSEPNDVRRLLFNVAKTDKKTFPASELLAADTTVGQVWARIVEKNSYRRW
jgi:PRTRC genetic system protein B